MLSGRAIALQGIGYSPKLIAVQGFADTEVVVYQPTGTFAPWVPEWLKPKVRRPNPRRFAVPAVVRVQSVAAPEAHGHYLAYADSVSRAASIPLSDAAWWFTAAQPSITKGRVIQNPGGRNDVTRMEEEALIVMMADDDEY